MVARPALMGDFKGHAAISEWVLGRVGLVGYTLE